MRRLDPLLVAYLPVTPDSLRFLVHVHGIDPQKTQLQPITVDVDAINSQQTTESRRRWRRALGVEETSLLVFTGGRLEPRKKTELLIRALNQPGLQGLNLAIVGQSGREHQEYFGHLRDVAGGSERIHFLGWRSTEEVHEIMGASDIAVFPASQSVLWQKAVGSGLPLIAGAMPGQDPSYMDLGNIMILRGEEISEQGVRNALRVLSRNPELRGEMSRAARKITKQLLDVEIAAERIVRILR